MAGVHLQYIGSMRTNVLVQSDLQICADWANPQCYSGTGTEFYNLVDPARNTGYIKNNVTYSTQYNGILTTGGANSGALYNVGDRIDIDTSAGGIDRFSGATNFSICFMNKWQSGGGKIFSTGSAGVLTGDNDNCIWFLWMDATQFFWWNSGGGSINGMSCSFNGTRTADIWQYVGATYSYNEAGNDIIRLYVNGIMVNSFSIPTATHSAPDRTAQTNMQWTLGGGYSSNCYNSNSVNQFGHFALYNKTLSDAEVVQNFTALRSRFGI